MLQVEPLLEVLVGKCLEQGLMEVMEEEELAAMRAHQQHYEQVCSPFLHCSFPQTSHIVTLPCSPYALLSCSPQQQQKATTAGSMNIGQMSCSVTTRPGGQLAKQRPVDDQKRRQKLLSECV